MPKKLTSKNIIVFVVRMARNIDLWNNKLKLKFLYEKHVTNRHSGRFGLGNDPGKAVFRFKLASKILFNFPYPGIVCVIQF